MNFGIFERVFSVQSATGRGTLFAIERGQRQYLVTASHIFENLQDEDELQIARGAGYWPLSIRVVGRSERHDVLVLAAPMQMCSRFGSLATPIQLLAGQDAYFLGFPGEDILPAAHGDDYPLAFIKRATISALVLSADGSDFLIDGLATKGFSGGPLVYQIVGFQPQVGSDRVVKVDYFIAGIVTNSKHFLAPLIKDGKPYQTVQAEFPTGIAGCCSIYHANRLIDDNPTGFLLPVNEDFGDVERGRIRNREVLKARLRDWYGTRFDEAFV